MVRETSEDYIVPEKYSLGIEETSCVLRSLKSVNWGFSLICLCLMLAFKADSLLFMQDSTNLETF